MIDALNESLDNICLTDEANFNNIFVTLGEIKVLNNNSKFITGLSPDFFLYCDDSKRT